MVVSTGMDNKEAAILADNTDTLQRIIRKHKDDLSYPNEYWSEQDIINLL